MNIQPDVVLNNFLYDTHEAIHYITASVSFEPETVHLQMEEIRQEIQVATSNYLVSIPTPNTNIIDAADKKPNYIEAFFQAHNSYPGPLATPISHISSPYAQEHLTPNIILEARATTTATATASVPNLSNPDITPTLASESSP